MKASKKIFKVLKERMFTITMVIEANIMDLEENLENNIILMIDMMELEEVTEITKIRNITKETGITRLQFIRKREI